MRWPRRANGRLSWIGRLNQPPICCQIVGSQSGLSRYKAAMTAQIFLIAPPEADGAECLKKLDEALAAAPVAALLLPRGTRGEGAYKAVVKAVAPRAQAAGVAVLIE